MKDIAILLVHHDPMPGVLRRDALSVGIFLRVDTAKTVVDAVDWLDLFVVDFDAVFVCYQLRNGINTIDSGFVQKCRRAGFGLKTGAKHLVAFGQDPEENAKLLLAGCNLVCEPNGAKEFFSTIFV